MLAQTETTTAKSWTTLAQKIFLKNKKLEKKFWFTVNMFGFLALLVQPTGQVNLLVLPVFSNETMPLSAKRAMILWV